MSKLEPHPTPGNHILNKLESTLLNDASIQSTAFMANRFLRRRVFKYNNNFFFLILNYLPLKDGVALNHLMMLCAQWFQRRSRKCKYRRLNKQTDRRRQKLIRTFSSGELKHQKTQTCF